MKFVAKKSEARKIKENFEGLKKWVRYFLNEIFSYL